MNYRGRMSESFDQVFAWVIVLGVVALVLRWAFE